MMSICNRAAGKRKEISVRKDLPRRRCLSQYPLFTTEKKIAAGALLPHEIIEQALKSEGEDNVAEIQWQQMVKNMTKDEKFSDSLAVCDVSRNMTGTSMKVCIALGLLVSNMSEEPWRGHIITFSEKPQLHLV
ncbi:hypothetical protein KI387_037535 [Taxus chinensis]|uniref:Uncharacterized protein n=1 Tax=Taxus chinensis TaxID=29808 RepID=A0AA38FSN1_TAXCH|nr:hypothetical protein KI387_037535 [Taxus chinensis]